MTRGAKEDVQNTVVAAVIVEGTIKLTEERERTVALRASQLLR